jgi:peptidoglycan/LPS O-acetylase OafA/YrhL
MPELDGLRGLACVMVVFMHQLVLMPRPKRGTLEAAVYQGLAMSWTAIDIFFVLSGFLIGGILFDNWHTRRYFLPFYVRRSCRVFPLYFGWLALYYLLEPVLRPTLPEKVAEQLLGNAYPLWSYMSFTQNLLIAGALHFGPAWLGITWSLAVEEQFYLVLPWMVRFMRSRAVPYVLGACILGAPILRMWLWYNIPYGGVGGYVLMPCRADELLLGVLGAWAVRQGDVLERLQQNTRQLYRVLAALFVGVVCLAIYSPMLASWGMNSIGYTWMALFYLCVLLIAVTEQGGPISRFLRLRWLQELGRISYCIYMIHITVVALVHGWLFGKWPRLVTGMDYVVDTFALALTVGIAMLSWRFFERPIVAWGHAYAGRVIRGAEESESRLPRAS